MLLMAGHPILCIINIVHGNQLQAGLRHSAQHVGTQHSMLMLHMQ
jgi:hypothetical protein